VLNHAPRHENVWGSARIAVSGQLHVPAALPPRKEPPEPIGKEVGWVPEPAWTPFLFHIGSI